MPRVDWSVFTQIKGTLITPDNIANFYPDIGGEYFYPVGADVCSVYMVHIWQPQNVTRYVFNGNGYEYNNRYVLQNRVCNIIKFVCRRHSTYLNDSNDDGYFFVVGKDKCKVCKEIGDDRENRKENFRERWASILRRWIRPR